MTSNRRRIRITCLLAALLVVLALAPACSDDPTLARSTYLLQVFANPQTLALGVGEEGESQITAVVYSAGFPVENVGVRFQSSDGVMGSGGAQLVTDAKGEVHDVLRTAFTTTVTATSGSVSGTVTVTVVGPGAAAGR